MYTIGIWSPYKNSEEKWIVSKRLDKKSVIYLSLDLNFIDLNLNFINNGILTE